MQSLETIAELIALLVDYSASEWVRHCCGCVGKCPLVGLRVQGALRDDDRPLAWKATQCSSWSGGVCCHLVEVDGKPPVDRESEVSARIGQREMQKPRLFSRNGTAPHRIMNLTLSEEPD